MRNGNNSFLSNPFSLHINQKIGICNEILATSFKFFKVINQRLFFCFIEDEDNEEAKESTLEDGKISSFDDHEDSVYCAEWSATDPWIFASLSYDGRLVINHVPRNIKFRILNLM